MYEKCLLNEKTLRHAILFCKNYKKEGKNIDDLIEHLKIQYWQILEKEFEKEETQPSEIK